MVIIIIKPLYKGHINILSDWEAARRSFVSGMSEQHQLSKLSTKVLDLCVKIFLYGPNVRLSQLKELPPAMCISRLCTRWVSSWISATIMITSQMKLLKSIRFCITLPHIQMNNKEAFYNR